MSVESRLREATSELEALATQASIPELSNRSKSRPLPGVLVGAAVVAAIAFLLLLVDLRTPPGFVTSEGPVAVTSTAETAIAEEILEYINDLREDNDISPLAANDDLREYANRHSVVMASDSLAYSDISDLIGPFSSVGENIGYGPTWTSILDAHAASPNHYSNMTATRFTDAGVGVYVDPDGRLWVTVIFGTP